MYNISKIKQFLHAVVTFTIVSYVLCHKETSLWQEFQQNGRVSLRQFDIIC